MLKKKPVESIVLELQQDIVRGTESASNILRKARLAAKKLGLSDFENWIVLEADGYQSRAVNSLPRYRWVPASPKFKNPYLGWCPIIVQQPDLREVCQTIPFYQSVNEIESLVTSGDKIMCHYPDSIDRVLRDALDLQFEICAVMSSASIKNIIELVKNTLLDWAVDLEKSGITGEGFSFAQEERQEAAMITQNIFAQNIGTLGNVGGGATVNNTVLNPSYSLSNLPRHIDQIRSAIPALPTDLRDQIERELANLETRDGLEERSYVADRLSSIKRICEGATGNLAAQAISALLASLIT
jgi:hypothetical protein